MRWFPFVLALAGCTGDKPPPSTDSGDSGDTDSGTPAEECAEDAECSDGEICEADVCVDGDRDNSVDEATSLLWESDGLGVINPAGDVDFYKFEADGGEFVRIRTVLNYDDGDTALTLRSPSGKVVASVDNYPTGGTVSTYDAVLYAYLASAGTYTIAVEDIGTYYSGGEPNGNPGYEYTVSLNAWSGHTDESDALDDPSVDVDITSGSSIYPVGVVLEEGGDVDYVDIEFNWEDAGLWVSGMADLGNSDAEPLVRLTTRDGDVLFSKEGLGPDGRGLYPNMTDGHTVLQLTDVDGDGGSNHWFFVFITAEDEGEAYPAEEEPNDESGGATVMDQEERTTSDGLDYSVGYGQGVLDPAGDVDWFRFEGATDGRLVVCLNSSAYGASVAPTLEVYSSDGELLETAEGDPDTSSGGNTTIENLSMDRDLYYLAVRHPDDDGGLDAWYRFVLYVADFDVETYGCP